jgi:Glycosyl hydrolases family 18
MPFAIIPEVAQFQGADWSNFLRTESNLTPASAQRRARADPNVGFFFFCRGFIDLGSKGSFNPGDAVFFSGDPWPGSAPQCDIYRKGVMTTGYVEVNSNNPANIGCYGLQDGQPFFDFACIFAANIGVGPDGQAQLTFNPQVSAVLNETDVVAQLQAQGVSVLLSVLNNWQNAGWSCFTEYSQAEAFAQQLADCVEQYGLDGIDIDDEYSSCTLQLDSLIMAAHAMNLAMPGKIVSKALWNDYSYFQQSWNGLTLAQTLTYGWEMSYAGNIGVLTQYVNAGMKPQQLLLGLNSPTDPRQAYDLSTQIKAQGFGGIMIFSVTTQSAALLSGVSSGLYNQHTLVTPGCLS